MKARVHHKCSVHTQDPKLLWFPSYDFDYSLSISFLVIFIHSSLECLCFLECQYSIPFFKLSLVVSNNRQILMIPKSLYSALFNFHIQLLTVFLYPDVTQMPQTNMYSRPHHFPHHIILSFLNYGSWWSGSNTSPDTRRHSKNLINE